MLVEMGVLEPDEFKTTDITSFLMDAAYSKLNIAAALSKYLVKRQNRELFTLFGWKYLQIPLLFG